MVRFMKNQATVRKAVQLRKKGFSLKEISERLNVAKSTASAWLKNVQIATMGKSRLARRSRLANLKSNKTKKLKYLQIKKSLDRNCKVLKDNKYSQNDYKLFLALLYWGEGAKTGRRVVFMNSDSSLISSYLFLLRKSFKTEESRFRVVLHLHEYHNQDEMLAYWSKASKIKKEYFSIYLKPHTAVRKKLDYKGCASVRYGDSKVLDEIFIIIDRFKNFAGLV